MCPGAGVHKDRLELAFPTEEEVRGETPKSTRKYRAKDIHPHSNGTGWLELAFLLLPRRTPTPLL